MTEQRKKPVRRVRVIEVIDEDDDGRELDIDEVLATAALAAEPEAAPVEEADVEPPKARKKKPPAVQDSEEEADEEDEPAAKPATKAAPRLVAALGTLRIVIAVAVVLIAALASFAIYEWRQASDLQSAKAERQKVSDVVSRFGNVVMNYDLSDISGSAAKIKPYLTGDALTALQSTVSELQSNAAKTSAASGAGFRSRTESVYVKDVNGRLASAVLIWTMSVTQGGNTQAVLTNIGLSIDLIKDGGNWKIAKYTATSSLGQLNLGGATASASPSPSAGK